MFKVEKWCIIEIVSCKWKCCLVFQASLITENGQIVTQITNSIQQKYSSLQSQHQDFATHLQKQLQTHQHQLAAMLQQQGGSTVPPPTGQYNGFLFQGWQHQFFNCSNNTPSDCVPVELQPQGSYRILGEVLSIDSWDSLTAWVRGIALGRTSTSVICTRLCFSFLVSYMASHVPKRTLNYSIVLHAFLRFHMGKVLLPFRAWWFFWVVSFYPASCYHTQHPSLC